MGLANLAHAISPLHGLEALKTQRRFIPEWFDEFGGWLELGCPGPLLFMKLNLV
jgi:hypothetical protein